MPVGAATGSTSGVVFAPTSPEQPAASSNAPAAATRLRLERFNDHRDPLTTADAGRAEPIPLASGLERVQEMRADARARRGERMAHRNRAAVDVEFIAIDAEPALHRAYL